MLTEAMPLERPYFLALRSDDCTIERFARQQRQFRFAVEQFARPLSLLAGRLADTALRDLIVRNVWEEHGQGDASLRHAATFRRFLLALGADPDDLDTDRPGVAVDAFNTALCGLCTTETVGLAGAALGMIELTFSRISVALATAIVERGWLSVDDLVHYTLHAALDTGHAEDLFAVAAAGTNSETTRGLGLGAHFFDRLYDDLRLL
jgi:pyrroloquinoline-quinone synthase